MIKKNLVFVFLIIFSFSNIAHSDSYQKTSPYWSTEKNGPRSMDQAIEMFFKDRPLDPLEGVWMSQDWGLVTIKKSGDQYHEYMIDVYHSGLNGTKGRTYFKTSNKMKFTFFTRISWEDGSWYVFKTSPGTLTLQNYNLGRDKIDRMAANPKGDYTRVWPTDLYSYNQKFSKNNSEEKVASSNNTETSNKTEKFYNLNWNNLDNPKNHDAEIPTSNATVNIIDREIYLTDKNDINELSLLLFDDEDHINHMVIIENESYDYTIYIEFLKEGYISLDDWKNVDSNTLLKDMKTNMREDIKDIKWVFDPKIYDNKHVTYSYEILWADGHKSLETKSLALGRKGYLDIAFVKKVKEDTNFQDYADAAVEFANTVKFNEGYKHTDYKSGDKVAAVGIGGLVAGTLGVKALAKAGAFAKLLPLLLKFGWILLIPLAFVGKLFGGKSQPSSSPDETFETKPKRTRKKKK